MPSTLRILLGIILAAMLCLGILGIATVFFADTTVITRFVTRSVSEALSVDLAFEQLAIDVLPTPAIRVARLVVRARPGDAPFIEIPTLRIAIEFLPLLRGHLVFEDIQLDQPTLSLRRHAEGHWSLPLAMHAESGRSPSWGIGADIRRLHIHDGSITFANWIKNGQHGDLTVTHVEMALRNRPVSPATFDVTVTATLATERSRGTILLTGLLDQRQPAPHDMIESLENRGPAEPVFHGRFQANAIDLSALVRGLSPTAVPSNWEATGALRSHLELFPSQSGFGLALTNITGRVNGVSFTGQGHVDGLATEQPAMLFAVSVLPCRIQTLRASIPETLLTPDIRRFLARHPFDGDLTELSMTVSGSLTDSDRRIVDGTLVVHRGSFRIDPRLPPLTDIAGSVRLDAEDVRIEHLTAHYGQSHVSVADAALRLDADSPQWDLRANAQLAAEDVVTTLSVLAVPDGVEPWVKAIDTARGTLAVAVQANGPVTAPKEFVVSHGELVIDDLGIQLKDRPVPFGVRSGRLTFDGRRIQIEEVAGWIGSSRIDLAGTLRPAETLIIEDIALEGSLTPETLKTLWPDRVRQGWLANGPIAWTSSFSGSLADIQATGRIDFSSTAIDIEGILHKPADAPAWVTMTEVRIQGHEIQLQRATLDLPPFQLQAEGRLAVQEPWDLDLRIRTLDGPAHIVPEGIVIGHPSLTPDTLDIDLALHGTGPEWTAWDIRGFLGLAGLSPDPASADPLRLSEATVNWTQREGHADMQLRLTDIPTAAMFSLAGSQDPPLSGSLSLQGIASMDFAHGQLSTRSLAGRGDLHIVDGHIFRAPLVTKILGLLNLPNVLAGKIDLLSEGLPFDRLTGTWSLTKGVLDIRDLVLKSPVLHATAAGTLDVANRRVNSIIAVSPFGAYTDLLKRLPMFGTILRGDRKGLATALFEVTGSIEDPDIRYLPIQSITEGLKSLVTLPLDLLMNLVPPDEATDAAPHDTPPVPARP